MKIKIGVLGSANIALRSIIPAIKSLPDTYELVGVATRDVEKSSLQNQELSFFEGYDSILDREILDAVYIPLPNSMHFEWVKKALEKGLHVLVEKSMGSTYSQVKELNQIARENNLALIENFQFRFHPQLKYILDILENKTLGELRYIRSSFCFPPFKDKSNIRYNKNLGGGALLDAGAYPIKISQLILGEELGVADAVLNSNKNFEVDIWGGATLKQKNGNLFAQINFGFDNYYQCNIEILGSEGRLYTNRIFTAGEKVIPKIYLETNTEGYNEIEIDPSNHFVNMLEYFNNAIDNESLKNAEYSGNINQSRILQELKEKANG